MKVYDTTIRFSLEKPLINVIIRSPFVRNILYEGPFQNIPKCLFNREVIARAYEYTTKDLILWVQA